MPVDDDMLETARANRASDPEGWDSIKTEYAEQRRAARLIEGRTIGAPPWPPDVVDYMRAHPDEPQVQTALRELDAVHAEQRAQLGLDQGDA